MKPREAEPRLQANYAAIRIRRMRPDDVSLLAQVDRSEKIERICRVENGQEVWTEAGHECPGWNDEQLEGLQSRFLRELEAGGTAFGAYDGERLAGFGLLGHRRIGPKRDKLAVDLMYVGRPYRRRGIATRFMQLLGQAAAEAGAGYLYISSAESSSAVGFYRSIGGENTAEPDAELLALEPLDIHMTRRLKS
ncbi:GNAT family N-acetyltransferase [Saccharibacillus sp. CPCC 101409]|uniref:GNAT family N-acetyltransferase n=1 Tax=Saccharibacillus sp. CPCC 101409 TaxID=3058041 RepID=UPI002673C53A|nr:GNAT family N-acetyltransferase [Saccharibacillus sp. CPCC 101409]MDO3411173.1 GNAT family N-acetyltransferase [Saccharibacillus sp. CPCC 101409]